MNTRKLAHAVAALAAAAAAVLVLPQPAQAAPAGPCSLEEWKIPANAVSCAARLREAAAGAAGCVSAPSPGDPTSGMAGWFAQRPDSSLRDGVQGQYSTYGVAGYGLDTYDLGCLGTLKYPELTMWNGAANAEFMTAEATMGFTNWLRAHAYDPGSVWNWSDGFVTSATNAVYKYVFNAFGAITLAGIGVYLIYRARRGSMSETANLVGWALLILTVTTVVARWPDRSVHTADSVANSGLSAMHAVLGPGPQDIPAEQCKLGSVEHPEACKDNRTVATRASDAATYAILYRSWLRAVLGNADSPVAKKYGPALFDATAIRWDEATLIANNPATRDDLIKSKATTFKTIADQIQREDPLAYEYLQGKHGTDRFGAGLIAMLSAFAFAVFDAASSIVILFAFGILRMVIPLVPLAATIGMFQPASGFIRRVGNAATAALFNIVVFGAFAGLYQTMTYEVFNSSLPGPAQPLVIALFGVAFLLFTRPVRRIVSTATGRSRGDDGVVTRAYKASKEIVEQRRTAAPAGPDAPGGARPELTRAGRTIVTAAYPSTATVIDNDTVAAGVAAARQPRPEGDTARARAGRIAAAMVDATPTRMPAPTTTPTATKPNLAAPAAPGTTPTTTPTTAPTHRPRPRPRPRRPETKDPS